MDIQDNTPPAEPEAAPGPAPAPEPTSAEPGTPEAPAQPAAPTDQAPLQPEKKPDPPMAPVWTDPDDITPEVRAYYWELERQLGLRRGELQNLEQSDAEGKTAVMQWQHDRVQTLRREIQLLNDAWAHPPFTIKDWAALPPAWPALSVDVTVRPQRISMEQQHADDVMRAILDCRLNPLAMRKKSGGCSSDRDIARAHYLSGRLARGQTLSSTAMYAFNRGWQTLLDTGRVRWA